MKYRIEIGMESKRSLTTIKKFSNANELKNYIKELDQSVWYVVEYSKTNQRIMEHNYMKEGTHYAEGIVIPKALMNL